VLVGAHTDSPGLRLKPTPDLEAAGYRQLGVQVYGSPLLSTWLDRDLSLAGRVSVAGGASHLVDFQQPICRIPSLAVHLNRGVNKNGLTLNAQDHLVPALGLSRPTDSPFAELVAERLGQAGTAEVTAGEILGFDLCLYDVQPGALGGLHDELLSASRLDNLVGCYSCLTALLDSAARRATQVCVLYDHEEVGSRTASGAQSRLLTSVLERAVAATGEASVQAVPRALARSLLVSVDMAHAVHPNYPEKHDKQHQPRLGAGPVVKVHANQSYATDGPAAAAFTEACQAAGFTPQRYVSRNDLPCGSTIGPVSAARTAIRTVDVGNPMLAMHSCREVAGTRDVSLMIAALTQLLSSGSRPDPAS
jgi:aspartyl aminopeptidase